MNTAEVKNVGEIRFGPAYFELSINGSKIENRLFSDFLIWSKDKHYLAVQEWDSIKESNGPRMKLTLFDLKKKQEYSSKVVHGYCIPKYFENNLLIYMKKNWSKGYEENIETELNVLNINQWKPNKKIERNL